MFALTFVEEVVAPVFKALVAALGANEASEGGEPGSEKEGELDHFDSGIASVMVLGEIDS